MGRREPRIDLNSLNDVTERETGDCLVDVRQNFRLKRKVDGENFSSFVDFIGSPVNHIIPDQAVDGLDGGGFRGFDGMTNISDKNILATQHGFRHYVNDGPRQVLRMALRDKFDLPLPGPGAVTEKGGSFLIRDYNI